MAIPSILWFLNRKNIDFSRQIKITSIVDAAFAVMMVIGMILDILEWDNLLDLFQMLILSLGESTIFGDSIGFEILYTLFGLLRVFSVWKMRNGKTFGSLFKKPTSINWLLFIIYLLATLVIMVFALINLLSYLIFGIALIVILWIVNHFVLGGGGMFPNVGGSSGKPVHHCCASCARNRNGVCAVNNQSISDPHAETNCGQFTF